MSNEGLTQRMETFDVKLNQNKELMQEFFIFMKVHMCF